MVTALAMVIGAIVLARYALRWFGFAPGALAKRRSVRVVENCPIGARQRLVVVDVGHERLLLGATDSQVSLVRALPPASEATADDPEQAPAEQTTLAPQALGQARAWLRAAGLPLVMLACILIAPDASAQSLEIGSGPEAPEIKLSVDGLTAPDRISQTLQIVFLMTLLSVAPSILLVATSFTRIVIVLSLLRQAVGVHQLPPNQVLVGLSLFLTIFVMAPVGERIHADALVPYMEQQVDAGTALAAGTAPVREHLLRHTRERDLQLFLDLAGADAPSGPEEVGLSSLLPAYMISEMRTAFEIGFMVYLPFLIIDLVIASMLISMGMIVLPPIVISLPFKLMLFVLLDGWNLVISALVKGLL